MGYLCDVSGQCWMASPVVRVRVSMAQVERQDKFGYLRRGARLQRERRMFLQGVFITYRSTQSERVGSASSPSIYSARIYPSKHFAFVNFFPFEQRTTSSSFM